MTRAKVKLKDNTHSSRANTGANKRKSNSLDFHNDLVTKHKTIYKLKSDDGSIRGGFLEATLLYYWPPTLELMS